MQDHIGQPVGIKHDTLLGNYRILRLLGQGSFANVYLGEHIHLHTQAAIKVLQVRLVESNIQSFLNEARTIAHLVHPYIIRVLDFGVEANTPFLVMDYAPQGTFRQRFIPGQPLPPTLLFPSIKQAASALQYAHDKKLIHRDVKPENMLLGPNEEILLSDFGFALIQTSVSHSSLETAGTASYMAPEQFQGNPQPASDQYSLGVIAYEWLAGSCPFQGTFMELASQHMFTQPSSLLQRVPGLSAQVAQVLMTALAKEPDQRFPSVLDFARSLEHACLNASTSFASIVSPPFPPKTGATPTPTQANQKPQRTLNLEHSSHDEAHTPFQLSSHSPALWSGPNAPAPASTTGPLSPQQALPSSPGLFQREQHPPLSPSLTFTSSSQSMPNVAEPLLPNLQSYSPQQTPRPPTPNAGPATPNILRVKPSESSISPALSRSQSSLPVLPSLPPLPQQPFLSPELTKSNMPTSMVSQTFPLPQNFNGGTSSPSRRFSSLNADSLPQLSPAAFNQQPSSLSSSRQTSLPQSTPLVRAEDFWKKSQPTTSWNLRIFIIFMIAFIIGSTALLVAFTNNQQNGVRSTPVHPTPHAHATATSQQTTPTPALPTNQLEQNPYGNHNGILVANDPLNQQDQQMQWDESPGSCSFTTGSYHVVSNPQSQGFTVCNARTSDYANFVYQVQMTFTKVTPGSSGGLVFRGNKTNSQFYFFEIFATGTYDLYRCPGTNGAPCPLLSGSAATAGPIASFNANLNQPNTIALIANDNTFNIYVNNQLAVGPIVDTAKDPAYSHGRIGMMARQNNINAVTDVSFSNLKLWKM